MQRYACDLKRAQLSVLYVLAMTITRDTVVFMCGEESSTKRLELILADGGECIEFVSILLGLAFTEHVDLGQNPDVCLHRETRPCEVNCCTHHSASSNVPSTATVSRMKKSSSVAASPFVASSGAATKFERPITSRTGCTSKPLSISSRAHNALIASNKTLFYSPGQY